MSHDPTFSGALADIGGRVLRCGYHGTQIVGRRCATCDRQPERGTAFRLSADDMARMKTRVREVVEGWRRQGGWAFQLDHLALCRVAHHAIGCSAADLRDSELDWCASMVHAVCHAVFCDRDDCSPHGLARPEVLS
jgi:hypothetical protein